MITPQIEETVWHTGTIRVEIARSLLFEVDMTDPVVIPAVEDQICVMLEEIAGIKAIVGERILANTDHRMTAWENVANYKGAAVDVTDDRSSCYRRSQWTAAVFSRSLNIRGAGRYAERVDIGSFCPVGIQETRYPHHAGPGDLPSRRTCTSHHHDACPCRWAAYER